MTSRYLNLNDAEVKMPLVMTLIRAAESVLMKQGGILVINGEHGVLAMHPEELFDAIISDTINRPSGLW